MTTSDIRHMSELVLAYHYEWTLNQGILRIVGMTVETSISTLRSIHQREKVVFNISYIWFVPTLGYGDQLAKPKISYNRVEAPKTSVQGKLCRIHILHLWGILNTFTMHILDLTQTCVLKCCFVSLLNVGFCDCKVPQKITFHSKGIIFIFSALVVHPSGVPYYNSCGICHFWFAPKQHQGLLGLKHSPSQYAYHALVLDLIHLPTIIKRLLVPSMVQSESLHWKMRCALL